MKKILNNLADVETALNELLEFESAIASANAEANKGIAAIRSTTVDQTGALEEKSKRLRSTIESWAEGNRDDVEIFPAGRKSLDLNAGTIAFKSGPPSVTLKKGFDTDDVIKKIQSAGMEGFLKIPDPTLDKSAVKKAFEQDALTEAQLGRLGLQITQTESLTISLKTIKEYA